jgi:Ala-tRNA(Pro) deacylase
MRIEKYLKTFGVSFKRHRHPKTFTAQQLAAQQHVSGHQVAKSVVVHVDNRLLLCVLPASYKVDLRRLADAFGADRCYLADELEMQNLFPDVEVGAEPPFGHLYGMDTLVDEHLTRCEDILFCGGDLRKAIEMPYSEYARVEEPEVMNFAYSTAV